MRTTAALNSACERVCGDERKRPRDIPTARPPGLPERFRHESDSDGHGQILFRASSADGRQCGARPEGWTSLTRTG